MVQEKGKLPSAHIACAARALIEGGLVDAAAGRFSRTIFLANPAGDIQIERCAFDAALKNGLGAVSVRFGRERGGTTLRANIAFVHDGAPLEVRNCVLWAGDDCGRIILVPFDARDGRHFAIGPDGLGQRPGRPATLLGQGMSRAKTRLERLARSLRQDELGLMIAVLADTKTA